MSLTFGTIKISVVSFYRRIFPGQETFRRWSMFLLIVIGLWMLAFFISLTLWCGTHPAAGWTNYKEILKYCDNLADLELAFAVTDAMTDLLVILTSIPVLWKLQLSSDRKIALTGIFLLGFLYVETRR
jgi:cytochrome c biogenesis protein CcdA